jgi:Ser/Thr protein kinase RdoA (MazF antagonist)
MNNANLEKITRWFLPFDRWLDAVPWGRGHINDTYRVQFEAGGEVCIYLLQRVNHEVFHEPEALMENIRKVAAHLSSGIYPYQVASPVAAPDGTLLKRDEAGNYWRMFPFFDHTYVPEGHVDAATAHAAARAYGTFIRALTDFPADDLTETIPGFHDTDRRWEVYLLVSQADPVGRASTVRPEIAAMLEAKPIFDRISHLKKSGDLPVRVTHNDTKAGNILFEVNTDRVVSVIDWDTVMPGTVLSDFGDMVRTFTPNGYEDAPEETLGLRRNIYQALTDGFLEETAGFLTPAEKDNLLLGGQWMAAEQALRFFTDYLAGDVYYKVDNPDHNLMRTRNQIRLLQLLSEI